MANNTLLMATIMKESGSKTKLRDKAECFITLGIFTRERGPTQSVMDKELNYLHLLIVQKLTLINNIVYTGDWVNNQKQGNGNELYPDNAKYEGQFSSNTKHGQGTFTWPDGLIYKGDF